MIGPLKAGIIAVAALIILGGCAVERKPGYVYTVTGRNLGAADWHEIPLNESQVSFAGSNPVKKREAQSLADRYRERLTFNNNAILFYSKSYLFGYASITEQH